MMPAQTYLDHYPKLYKERRVYALGYDQVKCQILVSRGCHMQAIGSDEEGQMLFLGLGTGLGSAMIVDGVVEPVELVHSPYKQGKTYEDYLGRQGLQRRRR